jgi:hypothetical protein
LSITIPCSLNSPSLSLAGTSASSICAGQPVNLQVNGADTYTWSTGATTSTISDVPSLNTLYMATGVNTLTGCSSTISKNVVVKPSPNVSIFVFKPSVCEGQPVTLSAAGAQSYTWNTGAMGQTMMDSPMSNTTYTVIGSNAFGCTGMSTQAIVVNPLPTVVASNVPSVSCVGQNILFSGSGASTYTWTSINAYAVGTQVIIQSPMVSTVYNVTGTDANGCEKTVSLVQTVEVCTGIRANASGLSNLNVYPNPTEGLFTVELKNGLGKTIELSDVTGRVILISQTESDQFDLNIGTLSKGVYYLKVKSDNAVEILKVVKQ